VVTYFVYGEELSVVDGPVVMDGYTWWKVEGKDGRGWSAQDFLVLVPENGN
jgi:hypothetical protein